MLPATFCAGVEQFTQSPLLSIPPCVSLSCLAASDCATSSVYLGGAAGGGYAQVIPMEEVRHTDTLSAP